MSASLQSIQLPTRVLTTANAFIALVIAAGGLELTRNLVAFEWTNPARFLVYFIVCLLISGLKLKLPGVTGTISVCFVFVMIGIVSLSRGQVILTGCAAVLVQYFWQSAKRPRAVQILFNIACSAIAISASYQTFYSSFLQKLSVEWSVRLAILGCTYYFVTTGLIAAVIGLTEKKSFFHVWRTSYLWAFPYYLLGAATAGIFAFAQRHLGWQTSMLVVPVVYLVYRSYRLHLGNLEAQKKHAEETAALHLRTIESLALAIEAKDHTTHDHLRRVQTYAVEIAKEMNLSEIEVQAVRAASLLHDIGKIAVPEHIICKPGKLTPDEFEKMKVHPVVGAEILARAQFPYPVVPIVHSHHEKWDGTGYPDGLRETEIPIGARILSAVDFLDALASDRQYRRALPLNRAMDMVLEQSGKAFDPEVVRILQARYVELEQMARDATPITINLSTDIKISRGAAPDAGFAEPHGVAEDLLTIQDCGPGHLGEVVGVLSEVLSPKEVFSVFACRMREHIHADCAVLYVREDHCLTAQYVYGSNDRAIANTVLSSGQSVSEWVAANGKPILNGNASVESALPELSSVLAAPVIQNHQVTGVLSLYRKGSDAFSPSDLRTIRSLTPMLTRLVGPQRSIRELAHRIASSDLAETQVTSEAVPVA